LPEVGWVDDYENSFSATGRLRIDFAASPSEDLGVAEKEF